MIRRPPRSTLDRSSAASDVYKRQGQTLSERPLPIVVDSAVDDQVLVDEEEFKITE